MEENLDKNITWADRMYEIAQKTNTQEKRAAVWLQEKLEKNIEHLKKKIQAEAYKGNVSTNYYFNTKLVDKTDYDDMNSIYEISIIKDKYIDDFLNLDDTMKINLFKNVLQMKLNKLGIKLLTVEITKKMIPLKDIEIKYVVDWNKDGK